MQREPRARGLLVAIEGIDGAGKTLQATMLEDRLRAAGLGVLRTKEPTNGHVEHMRNAILEGTRLSAEDELRIFVDDRKEHVRDVIQPALDEDKAVILDRYYFSNAAYQGSRGLDPEKILKDNEAFAPEPDLLVLLDTPVDEAIHRIHRRGHGRTLFEDPESLERCRAVFLAIERAYKVTMNGMCSPHEIHEAIVRRLDDGPLFQRLCLKSSYLPRCEPEYCIHRMDKSCRWIELSGLRKVVPVDPVIA